MDIIDIEDETIDAEVLDAMAEARWDPGMRVRSAGAADRRSACRPRAANIAAATLARREACWKQKSPSRIHLESTSRVGFTLDIGMPTFVTQTMHLTVPSWPYPCGSGSSL